MCRRLPFCDFCIAKLPKFAAGGKVVLGAKGSCETSGTGALGYGSTLASINSSSSLMVGTCDSNVAGSAPHKTKMVEPHNMKMRNLKTHRSLCEYVSYPMLLRLC